MKLLQKSLPVLLAVILPIMVICIAGNIIVRAPDLYQHEFKATEAIQKAGINVSEDEMGEFFSDYMLGKLDEAQLSMDTGLSEELLFTPGEQAAVERLAGVVNVMLIMAGALLVLAVVIYAYLLRKEWPALVRRGFRGALIFFVSAIIIEIVVYNIPAASQLVSDLLFAYAPGEEDILPQLLGRHFAKNCLIWGNMVCVVIMAILYYVTRSLTKPRRMFW